MFVYNNKFYIIYQWGFTCQINKGQRRCTSHIVEENKRSWPNRDPLMQTTETLDADDRGT